MIKLRQNKDFRSMCWDILTAICTYGISVLAWLPSEYQLTVVPIATLILRRVMKYLNVRFFNDLWVIDQNEL